MDAFRTGFVYVEDCYAGTLSETEDGYRFAYDADYLSSENPRAVSLTLPLRDEPYDSSTLFFFLRRSHSRRVAAKCCHAQLET